MCLFATSHVLGGPISLDLQALRNTSLETYLSTLFVQINEIYSYSIIMLFTQVGAEVHIVTSQSLHRLYTSQPWVRSSITVPFLNGIDFLSAHNST